MNTPESVRWNALVLVFLPAPSLLFLLLLSLPLVLLVVVEGVAANLIFNIV
jgi:hypothetical protein